MINLRYHIVSLVAVFLALTIGVIAGSTVIDKAIVRDLERQRTADRRQVGSLGAQNEAMQRELSLWDRFGEAIVEPQLRGRLRDKHVVVLTVDGVDNDLVTQIEDSVATAGGATAGRVAFTDKWRLSDQPAREQLALALGVTSADPGALLKEAAARLGARLQSPADPSADGDLIESLSGSGFVTLDGLARGAFPPAGSVSIFLTPGISGGVPDHGFALDLLRALAGGMPVAVAEPLGAADSLADRVRGDEDLSQDVATVDHADTLPGRLALVAGLQDLVAGLPARHFGVRRRTVGIAPVSSR